jgi:hypothetical protein
MASMSGGDRNTGPRPVAVRTGGVDAVWTLEATRVGRDWALALTSPDRSWEGTGWDCFEALRQLRIQLDAEGVRLGVNGARPNALCSGMQSDMGEGLVTYLVELGVPGRPPEVETLGAAPLNSVGTVAEQDDLKSRWLAERQVAKRHAD